MPVRSYDPGLVVLTVGGTPINGYADGTFIQVARSADSFSKVSGADGVVSRARSRDKSGEITITLAQTSPSNDVLSALHTLDETTGAGVVPVQCKDNSGRSVHFAAFAWVRKPADTEYGKEISDREWVLDCADLDPLVAGNPNSGT
jgi:hypothetical protein